MAKREEGKDFNPFALSLLLPPPASTFYTEPAALAVREKEKEPEPGE
jgi:hypothetical protein